MEEANANDNTFSVKEFTDAKGIVSILQAFSGCSPLSIWLARL